MPNCILHTFLILLIKYKRKGALHISPSSTALLDHCSIYHLEPRRRVFWRTLHISIVFVNLLIRFVIILLWNIFASHTFYWISHRTKVNNIKKKSFVFWRILGVVLPKIACFFVSLRFLCLLYCLYILTLPFILMFISGHCSC